MTRDATHAVELSHSNETNRARSPAGDECQETKRRQVEAERIKINRAACTQTEKHRGQAQQ